MKNKLMKTIPLMAMLSMTSCGGNNTITVFTECGFAPFEYVKNGKIVGVDVDIMNLVGEKLNKNIVFENIDFELVVDTVKEGKLGNVGAAGLSITDDRSAKVDFSHVYYQANLYVIYNESDHTDISKIMSTGEEGVYWSSLQTTLGIGVQTGTTSDLFLSDEIKENGLLPNIKKTGYQSYLVASQDIGLNIDYLLADQLPALEIAKSKQGLKALPLYYEGDGEDEKSYDEYAIAVTKGQDELLAAINEVIDSLLAEDNNGVNGIQALVNNHLGI